MLFRPQVELKGHSGAVYTLCGSFPFIYSGAADRFVARWNLESGQQEAFSIRCDASIYGLVEITDRNLLCMGLSNGSLHIIDQFKKQEIRHLKAHQSAVFSILENQELKQLYTTDMEGNLAIWSLPDFKLELFLPLDTGKIRSLKLHDQKLFLAGQDGFIRIFDMNNLNELTNWRAHEGGVNELLIDHEGKIISAGKDAHIRIWEKHETNYRLFKEIPAHHYAIYSLCFLNDGKYMASASRDKSIKIWDCDSWKVLQKMERKDEGHQHSVNFLLKTSENSFVSAGDDGRIIYWKSPA
ncbi:MAG: WD40 repeat domain-containing protein [Bacteroidetes bacterium]|nr:MAG: WD40 repeat domain-containing protein [Bacteroidota bacterium]